MKPKFTFAEKLTLFMGEQIVRYKTKSFYHGQFAIKQTAQAEIIRKDSKEIVFIN
jgi:hypothetical protein